MVSWWSTWRVLFKIKVEATDSEISVRHTTRKATQFFLTFCFSSAFFHTFFLVLAPARFPVAEWEQGGVGRPSAVRSRPACVCRGARLPLFLLPRVSRHPHRSRSRSHLSRRDQAETARGRATPSGAVWAVGVRVCRESVSEASARRRCARAPPEQAESLALVVTAGPLTR